MERPIPRYRAPILARRRGHSRRSRHPARRLARHVFTTRRRSTKSINFIVAHDGFTLADLVSYADKHNEANGENNRDGTNENYSWNDGVEGPADDPAIRAKRARDMRNLLALLLRRARRPDARDGIGDSATASAATTTPMLRTTRSPGSIGATPMPRSTAFVGRISAVRQAHPALTARLG